MKEPSQALVVLAYGTGHNDMELMDKAALHTMGMPPEKVFPALHPKAFVAWVRDSMKLLVLTRVTCWFKVLYYKACQDILGQACILYMNANLSRDYHQRCSQYIRNRDNLLRASPIALKHPDDIRSNGKCSQCAECDGIFRKWKEGVETLVANIPNFSTFLGKNS
jgi:hypothetical protein